MPNRVCSGVSWLSFCTKTNQKNWEQILDQTHIITYITIISLAMKLAIMSHQRLLILSYATCLCNDSMRVFCVYCTDLFVFSLAVFVPDVTRLTYSSYSCMVWLQVVEQICRWIALHCALLQLSWMPYFDGCGSWQIPTISRLVAWTHISLRKGFLCLYIFHLFSFWNGINSR